MRIKEEVLQDPLCPVEKVPFTVMGDETDKFAIVLHPETPELRTVVGNVSERYQLIPNQVAHDVAMGIIGESKLVVELGKGIWDGKRYRQRWYFPEVNQEVKKGDVVQTGIDLRNSYDGSTLFSLGFVARRLVCDNGMMLDFLIGGIQFKHFSGNGNGEWKEEVKRAVGFLSDLGDRQEAMLPHIDRMMNHQVGLAFMQGCFASLNVPDQLAGNVVKNMEDPGHPTEWGLYNGFTRAFSEKETIAGDNKNRVVSKWFFDPKSRIIS